MYVIYDERFERVVKIASEVDIALKSKPWIKVYETDAITEENLKEILKTKEVLIENGEVVLKDKEIPFGKQESLKERAKKALDNVITWHIEYNYPSQKQRGDEKDIEFWGTFLIQKLNYDEQTIRKTIYESAAKIIEGETTFKDEVKRLSTDADGNPIIVQYAGNEINISEAWEQLIKAAIRITWLQMVKRKYKEILNELENSEDEMEFYKWIHREITCKQGPVTIIRDRTYFAGFDFLPLIEEV